jgi:hypothetical protein
MAIAHHCLWQGELKRNIFDVLVMGETDSPSVAVDYDISPLPIVNIFKILE